MNFTRKLFSFSPVLLGILCIFLLAGTPVMAGDTLTGCLTPGGTLTRIATGDAPKGGRCPGNSLEVTLGGSANSGVRDVELVTEEVGFATVPAGLGLGVSADCPEGKYVIGGGAFAGNPNVVLNTSQPDNETGQGWNAYFVSRYGEEGEAQDTTLIVHAICATVDNYILPTTTP